MRVEVARLPFATRWCDAARAHGRDEDGSDPLTSKPGADALRQQRHPPERGGAARRIFRCAARIEGRTARASTNRLDAEAIREVVEQAIAITRLTEPDEESLPMAGAGGIPRRGPLERGHRAGHARGAGAGGGRGHRRGGRGRADRRGNLFDRATEYLRC